MVCEDVEGGFIMLFKARQFREIPKDVGVVGSAEQLLDSIQTLKQKSMSRWD